MKTRKLLQTNPEPIKLVDQAVRDVWTKVPRRCHHFDGRGRCTSYDTKLVIDRTDYALSAYYCPKHRS